MWDITVKGKEDAPIQTKENDNPVVFLVMRLYT